MLLHTPNGETRYSRPTTPYRSALIPGVLQTTGKSEPAPSTTSAWLAALVPILRDDVAQLRPILDRIPCQTAIRPMGKDFLIPLTGTVEDERPESREFSLSSALFDPVGVEVAGVQIQLDAESPSCPARPVLDAILQVVTQAIAERWFRVYFRRRWILAARRVNDGRAECLLLALNRDRQVVGADQNARALLPSNVCAFDRPIPASAFFGSDKRTLRGSRHDLWLTLTSNDETVPWNAVLTPPCLSANERTDDHRTWLHSRPRLHSLDGDRREIAKRPESSGLPARMVHQIREYIEGNLASSLSIEALADTVGKSRSSFSRSFLLSMGATPHHYVMQRRLSKARQLLEESELPLAEIALMTGFADQSHFCRRFHESSGMAPLRYRRMHR